MEIIAAIDTTREELRALAQVLIERLDSAKGRREILVLRPNSLEPEVLESLPGWEQKRNILSGWPTVTSTRHLAHHSMQLDDEALCKPSPTINFLATWLYGTGHPICGVVLLIPHALTE